MEILEQTQADYMAGPKYLYKVIEAAEAQGFVVHRADDYTLLLDLDTQASIDQFWRVLPVVVQHYAISPRLEFWRSKNGHYHVSLKLNHHLECLERYALQAMLGSDGVRELLSIRDSRYGVEPSVLFQPRFSPIACYNYRVDGKRPF
jgi:hypothetical protein